jgi:hypothetical protein
MFNMIKSGDLIKDFSTFTDMQSGKKSDDPNDPAAKFPPPTPAKDGHYYHTIRDITWQTFKSFFPKTDTGRFYNMTDSDRAVCIKFFIDAGSITKDKIINIMLSYCVWATGNCNTEQNYYRGWYNVDMKKETLSTMVFLDRVTDIRLYFLTQIPNYNKYGLGWKRGVMCMWKLLNQYI